jgi:hypothetical protein
MVVDQFEKAIGPKGVFITLMTTLKTITGLPRGPLRTA